jgi:B-cell receptor-associated protein 31
LKKAARGEEENEEKELKAKLEERNNALVEELNEAQRGKEKAQIEMEALKKQAEGVNKEYDRLLAEHNKLQEKVKELEGLDREEKKDQ